jgi:hypothetical protein
VDNKVALVIYTHVEVDATRVYRALGAAAEFADAGDDVAVVFDGQGVETLAEIGKEGHQLHRLLEMLRPHVRGVCGFCAKSHGVAEAVTADGWTMLSDYKGHASIRGLVEEGRVIFNH